MTQAKLKAVGRNDPCPCGSGKKYKQCCLSREEAAAAVSPLQTVAPVSIPRLLQEAMAHHQVGRLPEAEALYRRVLQQDANQPDALHLLGLIAHQVGKHQVAIEWIGRAIEIRPTATMYCNLGLAYDATGRRNKAVEHFHQALAMQPGYVDAYINLGASYKDQGRLTEAIDSYRKALKCNPDCAEAHFNLGLALQGEGLLDEALAHFHQGLTYKPDYARAYALMASIHIDRGQFDLAQAEIGKALARDPDTVLACALQAGLRKMTTEDAAWLAHAQDLLARHSGTSRSEDLITLSFAIGKYHDDTKQYAPAFAAFSQANALRRGQDGGLDRTAMSRRIDAAIATYTADFFRQQRPGASDSQRPVLIVGMPRSGTSLTEQIIASHPQASGAGELTYWGTLLNVPRFNEIEALDDPARVANMAQGYEQVLQQQAATASRVVDKMPGNYFWLGLIATVLPHARIIHTQRNPIDTCLSIYFQNFNARHTYATDLDDLAYCYREYRRIMAHWRCVLPPERFLEVPYEALTADQEGWSRRIIAFLGLEWDDRCLDFHKTERKVGTASNWQVRQKIYQTSKERWRNYEQYLGPLLGLLEDQEAHS